MGGVFYAEIESGFMAHILFGALMRCLVALLMLALSGY